MNYQEAINHMKKIYAIYKTGDQQKNVCLKDLSSLYIQMRSLKEFLEARRTLLIEESKSISSWFGFALVKLMYK